MHWNEWDGKQSNISNSPVLIYVKLFIRNFPHKKRYYNAAYVNDRKVLRMVYFVVF